VPARAPAAAPNTAIPLFAWPARGTIVARFGERGILSTGIGISGSVGQDVLAAAPGQVVYVGSGLPQYGQVVIVKHNETWLTAYGHNQRLLVTQDQTVARGQKIGEMGLGPGRQPRLYFEIRRNGDPLDPLDLLPGSG
jgi:lipoprotein NlpD